MGKFVIKTSKNQKFYFNLNAANGEVILTSEMYEAKASCKNGIESVKKNSQIDDHFTHNEASNGEFYFTLKAGNNEIIGKSEMYKSKASMENGIASVKKNAPDAEIEEEL